MLDQGLGSPRPKSHWKLALTPKESVWPGFLQPCTSETGSSPTLGLSRGKWERVYGGGAVSQKVKKR